MSFTTRTLVDGVAYELPRRPLGRLNLVAGFFVLVGALVSTPAIAIGVARVPNSVFDVVGIVFASVFALTGLAMLLAGLAMLLGRTTIAVRGGRLESAERLWLLRWRRRRSADGLTRLEVSRGRTTINGRVVTEGVFAEMSIMLAVFEDRGFFVLAAGYPASWMMELADALADRLGATRPAGLVHDDERRTIEVRDVSPDDDTPAFVEREYRRPHDTKVVIEKGDGGVTLTLPPAGLLKGSKGLFVFGILWCSFMTFFSAFTVVGPAVGGSWHGGVWAFLAFSVAFWVIGIVLLAAGVNMGRRHAIIDVVEDTLLVNRKNIFGIRSHSWPRDNIETIEVGPSGMEVNDVPVLELKIRPREGKTLGLFAGRDEDELRWIAHEVGRALQLR